MTSIVERLAVYIANLFFLTSDTSAPVLKDKDLTEEVAGQLTHIYQIICLIVLTRSVYTTDECVLTNILCS